MGDNFRCMILVVLSSVALVRGLDFNVLQYGGVGDGRTDNAKAFATAWSAACQWKGSSNVVVPVGTYMLSTALFRGPCEGPISFEVRGVVMAYANFLSANVWINFQYIDRLSIHGGGMFDGQGALAWSKNSCSQDSNCQQLPLSMGFDFVTNSWIEGIRSINSKNTHINLFGCTNVTLTRMAISAPGNSPNTDGIRIGSSTDVHISQVSIATGDDCISILAGTRNLGVSGVWCGPGHGISVGSLGRYQNEEDVKGLWVRNCTFAGTLNGLRIKTWASGPSRIVASDIWFQDIEMRDVSNPIIIDQNYCPYPPCSQESASQVKINSIFFRNIWGTSATMTAVFLRCSSQVPCVNINLQDINLAFNGVGGKLGTATSVCYHANGIAYGDLRPRPCIHKP